MKLVNGNKEPDFIHLAAEETKDLLNRPLKDDKEQPKEELKEEPKEEDKPKEEPKEDDPKPQPEAAAPTQVPVAPPSLTPPQGYEKRDQPGPNAQLVNGPPMGQPVPAQ